MNSMNRETKAIILAAITVFVFMAVLIGIISFFRGGWSLCA